MRGSRRRRRRRDDGFAYRVVSRRAHCLFQCKRDSRVEDASRAIRGERDKVKCRGMKNVQCQMPVMLCCVRMWLMRDVRCAETNWQSPSSQLRLLARVRAHVRHERAAHCRRITAAVLLTNKWLLASVRSLVHREFAALRCAAAYPQPSSSQICSFWPEYRLSLEVLSSEFDNFRFRRIESQIIIMTLYIKPVRKTTIILN